MLKHHELILYSLTLPLSQSKRSSYTIPWACPYRPRVQFIYLNIVLGWLPVILHAQRLLWLLLVLVLWQLDLFEH